LKSKLTLKLIILKKSNYKKIELLLKIEKYFDEKSFK
jgi:hypothetical protein